MENNEWNGQELSIRITLLMRSIHATNLCGQKRKHDNCGGEGGPERAPALLGRDGVGGAHDEAGEDDGVGDADERHRGQNPQRNEYHLWKKPWKEERH